MAILFLPGGIIVAVGDDFCAETHGMVEPPADSFYLARPKTYLARPKTTAPQSPRPNRGVYVFCRESRKNQDSD
jgi:hypothetical protein